MTDILISNSYYLARDQVAKHVAYFYPPLGPLYIAAYLRQVGPWHIEVFDSTFALDESEYERVVHRLRPRAVGIQSFITTRRAAQRMIQIAKSAGAYVVLGGPDPSACYQDYLRWGADFVVIGEGELTAAELMFCLTGRIDMSPRSIHGLAFWDNSDLVVTPRCVNL
jgi:radical SAM superfamily enzyme YgiQ (UPF0313 family)